MILRIDRLGAELPPPSDPDPEGANAVQELMGGRFGEMSTLMNYTSGVFRTADPNTVPCASGSPPHGEYHGGVVIAARLPSVGRGPARLQPRGSRVGRGVGRRRRLWACATCCIP